MSTREPKYIRIENKIYEAALGLPAKLLHDFKSIGEAKRWSRLHCHRNPGDLQVRLTSEEAARQQAVAAWAEKCKPALMQKWLDRALRGSPRRPKFGSPRIVKPLVVRPAPRSFRLDDITSSSPRQRSRPAITRQKTASKRTAGVL